MGFWRRILGGRATPSSLDSVTIEELYTIALDDSDSRQSRAWTVFEERAVESWLRAVECLDD
jgi:hypothetical protein